MTRLPMIILAILLFHVSEESHAQNNAVDGDAMQLHSVRKGTGLPVVVFVSGMGEDHSTWTQVQDSISKKTTTISYDRAGLGLSQYQGETKNLTNMSRELYQLLEREHVVDPVVFVGHSLGCQIIKKFAATYPAIVRSIIFIDPGYNPLLLKQAVSDSLWNVREALLKKYTPAMNEAQQAEADNLVQNTGEADSISYLPHIPVVLFTATRVTDFPASEIEIAVKKQAHELWLQNIPQAKHVFVSESRHYIHNDQPQLINSAIMSLLDVQ